MAGNALCPSALRPPSVSIKGQLADHNTQHRRGKHIAGKMDIEIQPRKGDERRERDGRIAEAAVRFRQNRRADDRGQGMTRWERIVCGVSDEQPHAAVQPAGARAGDEVLQAYVAHQHADRQTAEQKKPLPAIFFCTQQSVCRRAPHPARRCAE